MHEELIKELEQYKKELITEIIREYKTPGHSEKADALFERWSTRLGEYLSSIDKKEFDKYNSLINPEIGGTILDMDDSDYDYFMNNLGRKIIAYIETFIDEIKKGRYNPPSQHQTLPTVSKTEPVLLEPHQKLSQNMHKYINKEPEITTIFIDIVKFSSCKHSERMVKVKLLNSIVKQSATNNDFSAEEGLILIPTGDGMAISIKTDKAEFAIDLASKIRKEAVIKELAVRIGLNKAQDTIIQDINSNINLCGPGIIGAQRIMDFGNAHDILVSESVYASIADRKGPENFTKKEKMLDKHKNEWNYYQYLK